MTDSHIRALNWSNQVAPPRQTLTPIARGVAPLPLTDAERAFLGRVLATRRARSLRRQLHHQQLLDDMQPNHPDFAVYLERIQQASYTVAMCDVLSERLAANLADFSDEIEGDD